MIWIVGSTKGGVGKTTLAVNLAVALAAQGRDVLLVDGDEQAQSIAFTDLRAEQQGKPGYTAVALAGAALRVQVQQLAPKYADVVIDVGGRDTGSFRAALTIADLLLIPVQPRSLDLWATTNQTAGLVAEARQLNDSLRAVAFLNVADPQGKDNEAALEALREIPGIEVAPVMIGRRKAFPNALAAGRSVLEYNDRKARLELQQLMAFATRKPNDIGALSHGNRKATAP